jgi:hypothetical protein
MSAIAGEDEGKATADLATVTLPEVIPVKSLPCVAAPFPVASSSGPESPKPPAVLKAKLSASASTDAALAERSRQVALGSTPAAASSVADTRTKTIIVVDLGSDDDIKPPTTTTKATTSVAGKKTHKTPSDLLQSKQKQQIGISKGVKRPASSHSTRQLSTAAADRDRPASGAADARKRLEGEGAAAAGLRRPVENEKTESSSSRGGGGQVGVVGNTTASSLKQTEKLVKVR